MAKQCHLHHEITGDGPPLVVLHGLFGDADNFRSIALQLERSFEVFRLDLPGHGRSDSLPVLSIEAMAEAVQEHVARAISKPYFLLGHSLGGKIAMSMASHPANTIARLIVADIAPKLYPPHHEVILAALQSLELNELNRRSDADIKLSEQIPDAGVRGFLLKSLYRNEQQQFAWRFDLETLATSYEAIRQPPTMHEQVTVPTLFIRGGNSDYLKPTDEALIHSLFAEPQLKELAGTGHWLHAEKPAEFSELCLEFLLN